MSAEVGFRYITRAFVLFFLFWIFVDLAALPRELLGLLHHIHLMHAAQEMGRYVDEEAYWIRYYILNCAEIVLKIAVYLWITPYFYRGAPALRRFFTMESNN